MKIRYEGRVRNCYSCPLFHKSYNVIKESETVKVPKTPNIGRVMETNNHGTLIYMEGCWFDNCISEWDIKHQKNLLPCELRPCPIEVKK